MFKTLRNAFKVKDIRKRLLFTLLCLVVVRIGSQMPVPGIDRDQINAFLANLTQLDFLNAITGGSFESLSIFALSITPYITSSIIIQLLTIAIPSLEEMQKEGEDGRKKIAAYTRYVTIILAIIESTAMAIGFGRAGYMEDYNFLNTLVVVISLTAGASFLMWLGEKITDYGIGNGISIILLFNIVSRMPSDIINLFKTHVVGASSVMNGVIATILIVGIIVGLTVYIVVLNDAVRKIPVQYAQKIQGRRLVGGSGSNIPLKVNTGGVMPVIFASSILQTPIVICSFLGIQPASGEGASVGQKILKVLNQGAWCNFSSWGEAKYTLGLVLYILLLVFFAYFYTSITFNPIEVANNLKKAGGFIPGIRPGRPTSDYLNKVLNSIIFIGAIGLIIAAIIPIICAGVFNANVSFGGTSLIIVVGVVLETINQLESMMLERHYTGFLND
ncbi:MAG: preprotein translocase subunit SecY [Catonella sp.]|jgi:preprotein translocase subunit SecY|nr:preprotein translocase subunit SecY [Catonella sp.]MDY6357468.1 preprotein translocase subunit SecY [Catonella sp.]